MTDDEKRLEKARRAVQERPTYKGSYEKELKSTYDSIAARPEFSYAPEEDALYRKYKADYTSMGRRAMQDGMGQAAALTGGYSSSYAQSVGQQRYDEYLEKLGGVLPELYSLAYSRYKDDGDALRERYDMLSALRDREYEEYTDALDDYNTSRALEYEMAQDERERADKQAAESYERALSEAATRAKYGDFTAYAAIYGEDTAAQMKNYWISANPSAAYGMGLISAERYYALTGGAQTQTQSGTASTRHTYYPNTAPDGRDAAQVQRELKNAGYNIAVDGAWGPKSQAAWDKAQKNSAAAKKSSGGLPKR